MTTKLLANIQFVREAVQAFPELYFSRLVILGEGDSEEIVLPRLLREKGLGEDDASISVVPLGGRHVNHFWRLLEGLDIPYVTLLDLDLGRHQGGWGRVRYAAKQLLALGKPIAGLTDVAIEALPKWHDDNVMSSEFGKKWLDWLESWGVFFSPPLDLDFALLWQFSNAYDVKDAEIVAPDDKTFAAVLGKCHGDVSRFFTTEELYQFESYHQRFKVGSKPAAHLEALTRIPNGELALGMPDSIEHMMTMVKAKLAELPE